MATEDHPKYYSEQQVLSVMSWPMINNAVEAALSGVSRASENSGDLTVSEDFSQPPRTVATAGSRSKLLLCMPGYLGNYQLPHHSDDGITSTKKHSTLTCKLVTSFSENGKRDPPLPNILAHIMLFDTETGQLKCIMGSTQITAWRTAAASVVATKYLYFNRFTAPPETKIAIIGCGAQGESHAFGMCETFPVSDIFLWNRTAARAERLADKLRAKLTKPIRVYVAATAADCVREAEIVCVGTYSSEPLIQLGMLKDRNVHINTVGAGQVHYGEVGQDIYDIARVYVDSMESARIELKGLKTNIIGEVGEVINSGNHPQVDDLTIFQSMGMAVEDATVAQSVYDLLQEKCK